MNKAESIQIRDKCRNNGGPLATKAADSITWLLKFCPEPQKAGLHPYHRRIVLLFQKRLNKDRRDDKEVRAFKKIQDHITEDDLAALERFYRAPKPKEFHELLSCRKHNPITLLNQYINQVELALHWCQENPAQSKKPEIPSAPENWQARAPGRLGEFSWSMVWKQYNEIAVSLQDPKNDLSSSVQ